MERFRVYMSVIMLLLKLTRDISQCVSVNDTHNTTFEKAMTKEVSDYATTNTLQTLENDSTQTYLDYTTAASVLKKTTKEITGENVPINTDKNAWIKSVVNKKSDNITDENSKTKSDKTMNNDDDENNETKILTAESVQNNTDIVTSTTGFTLIV